MTVLRPQHFLVIVFFVASSKAENGTLTDAQTLEVDSIGITISTVALLVVIVLALTGNTLVCVAFYSSSNLRSVTNVFIVSLAVTDILVAVVSIPVWLIILHSGCLYTWYCNPSLMALWRCLDILFSTASIMNLCAISCDRYIAITSPLRYPEILTKSRALVALLGLWSYALLMSTLNLLRWSFYSVFVFVVAFILPLTVMIFTYSCIFHAALRQARRVQPMRQAFYFKREIKAAKTLAIVMGAFIVCWAPFFVSNLLVLFHRNLAMTPTVTLIIKWLHYGNSALNPVIYSSSNRDFRFKILRVLPCKCGVPSSGLGDAIAQFWGTSFRSTVGRSSSFRKGSSEESKPAELQIKELVSMRSLVSVNS